MKKHIIGFNIKSENSEDRTEERVVTQVVVSEPRKSIVRVYFPNRNMTLSYYNDMFDLHKGDTVYVEGKLEGLQGQVVDVNYSFKIKLSDYKKVIAVIDTTVTGDIYFAGSHMVTFDKKQCRMIRLEIGFSYRENLTMMNMLLEKKTVLSSPWMIWEQWRFHQKLPSAVTIIICKIVYCISHLMELAVRLLLMVANTMKLSLHILMATLVIWYVLAIVPIIANTNLQRCYN